MRDERTTYREHTPGPTWARVILWAGIIVAAYVVLAGWESELPAAARVPVAVGIVGLGVAVQTFLGGLTVLVRESMILLHLEGDRLLLIGSDRPRQLEERIRAAVGPRLNRG
jgi:hypothetical protein